MLSISNDKDEIDKILKEKIKENPEYLNYFNLFKTLNIKSGVCVTYAGLMDFVNRFYGINSRIIYGTATLNNGAKQYHAVTKIYNKYYDPTFGLSNPDKYFSMSITELHKYFKEDNLILKKY